MAEGRKRLSDVPTTAVPSDGATIIVNDDGIKQVPRSAILQGALNADAINYDNASSALGASNVQSAIDEVAENKQGNIYRKIKTYTNIVIPSNHYAQIDTYTGLGLPNNAFILSMNIRGWSSGNVPSVVKGSNGTTIYLTGTADTYTNVTVEYFYTYGVIWE